MKRSYDFFEGKENLTDKDIEDFEAHSAIMQDRDLRNIEIEQSRKYNQSLQPATKSNDGTRTVQKG